MPRGEGLLREAAVTGDRVLGGAAAASRWDTPPCQAGPLPAEAPAAARVCAGPSAGAGAGRPAASALPCRRLRWETQAGGCVYLESRAEPSTEGLGTPAAPGHRDLPRSAGCGSAALGAARGCSPQGWSWPNVRRGQRRAASFLPLARLCFIPAGTRSRSLHPVWGRLKSPAHSFDGVDRRQPPR